MDIDGELVLMEPENKPPFLAVYFYRDYDAFNSNNQMIQYCRRVKGSKMFPLPVFHLQFELFAGYCNIRVLCSNPLDVYFYHRIKYNSFTLMTWLGRNSEKEIFNFGHMYKTITDTKPRLSLTAVNPAVPALIKIDKISVWIDFGLRFDLAAESPKTSLNIVKNAT